MVSNVVEGSKGNDIKFCNCGCGQEVKNKFVLGHTNRGKRHSPEWILRMSLMRLGDKNPMFGRKHPREADKHHMWKGDDVGNKQLHKWVRNHLPKPELCEMCRIKPSYDLANITGIYNREFKNWKYTCRSCHMISDGRMERFVSYQRWRIT